MTADLIEPPDPAPAETRLGALLDALGVGVVRVSLEGIVLEANTAFLRIVGAHHAGVPVVGTSVRTLLVPGREWESVLEAIRAGGTSPPRGSVEGEIVRMDGTVARVSGVGRVVAGHDRSVVEGIVRDVSAEHALRQDIKEVSTRERRRLGSALHDDLGPLLTALSLAAQTLGNALPGDVGPDARWRVGRIQSLAQEAATRARLLAHASQEGPSSEVDLVEALRRMTARWEALFEVQPRMRATPSALFLPAGDAQHVFYIVQEAVTNAVRHGNARTVHVSLDLDDGFVVLSVSDDGAGLAHGPHEGLGTRLMRHRARLLGGGLELANALARGVRVTLRFPLHDRPAAERP